MPKHHTYMVVYECANGSFGGFVPDAPGIFSMGKNLKQMRRMMKEALEFGLSCILTDGDPIPEPICQSFDFTEFRALPEHSDYYVVEWLQVKISKKACRKSKKIEPGYSMHQEALAARKSESLAA